MSDRRETWIVDRFEGEFAVVERALHQTLTVPRTILPTGTREGDVLRVSASAAAEESHLAIGLDREETRRRAAEAARLLGRLKEQDSGADVKL